MYYLSSVDYGRDLNLKIGNTNFTYKEAINSQTAVQLGLANIPNEEEWKIIEVTAEKLLQPIRDKFGPIRVNSWFRSPRLSDKIPGSSKTSNHRLGTTVDLEPVDKSIPLFEVLSFIHHNIPYKEMIAEYFPTGWVHVAYARNTAEEARSLKIKDNHHNYTKVTFDELKKIVL